MLALFAFAFSSFLCTQNQTFAQAQPLGSLSMSLSGSGDQGNFLA